MINLNYQLKIRVKNRKLIRKLYAKQFDQQQDKPGGTNIIKNQKTRAYTRGQNKLNSTESCFSRCVSVQCPYKLWLIEYGSVRWTWEFARWTWTWMWGAGNWSLCQPCLKAGLGETWGFRDQQFQARSYSSVTFYSSEFLI